MRPMQVQYAPSSLDRASASPASQLREAHLCVRADPFSLSLTGFGYLRPVLVDSELLFATNYAETQRAPHGPLGIVRLWRPFPLPQGDPLTTSSSSDLITCASPTAAVRAINALIASLRWVAIRSTNSVKAISSRSIVTV